MSLRRLASDLAFTGYRRDAETGLDYALNRYYAPDLGRFTTEDPITETEDRLKDTQGLNFFGYVKGNPLKYADPDGLEWGKRLEGKRADGSQVWGYRWFDGKAPKGWVGIGNTHSYKDGDRTVLLMAKGKWDYADIRTPLNYAKPKKPPYEGPGLVEEANLKEGQIQSASNAAYAYNFFRAFWQQAKYETANLVLFGALKRQDRIEAAYKYGFIDEDRYYGDTVANGLQTGGEVLATVATAGAGRSGITTLEYAGSGFRTALSGTVRAGEATAERFAFGEAANATSGLAKGVEGAPTSSRVIQVDANGEAIVPSASGAPFGFESAAAYRRAWADLAVEERAAALGERLLEERGKRAFSGTTIAAGAQVTEESVHIVVSSNIKYGVPRRWLLPGEEIVPYMGKLEGQTIHHAEQQMITWSQGQLSSVAASRRVCPACAQVIEANRISTPTPLRGK